MNIRSKFLSIVAALSIGGMIAAPIAPQIAEAANPVKSVQIVPSPDGKLYSRFPAGNGAPNNTCDVPVGWACIDLGTGGGTIAQASATDWDFDTFGTSSTVSNKFAYKDAGSGDVQMVARVTNTYAGNLDPLSSVGIGLREDLTTAGYIHQCFSPYSTGFIVQSNYGNVAPYANVNGSAGQARPRWVGMTYDVSLGVSKCFESANGSTWVEVASVDHVYSDVKAYAFGQSKSTTASFQAKLDNIALTSTITLYTPGGGGPNGSPVVLTPIPNKSVQQGSTLSFSCAANFVDPENDPMTFTVTGLPSGSGLNMSSSCQWSGAANASDLAASPFNAVVTAHSGVDGVASDTFQITVSPNTGTTWNIATGTTAFNCAPVNPGDTVVLAAGAHSATTFSNCHGSAQNPITVKNNTSGGTRVTINTTGANRFGIKCDNCEYVNFDGTGGWSGQAADHCGVVDNPDGIDNGGEAAIDEYVSGCGIYIDGTSGAAQDGVLLFGWPRRFITVQGFEIAGDWTGQGDNTYSESHGINSNDQNVCRSDHVGQWVEGIVVRKNYIHDMHDTAMYLGPNVRISSSPCAGNDLPWQRNIIVEYNIVDTIGEGGSKIKSLPNSDPKTAIIRYNHFRNGGGSTEAPATGHNSILFSCYESSCEVYGNVFDTTVTDTKTGPGLACSIQHRPASWGQQVCHFYNNVIYNTSGGGITANRPASGCCGTTSTQQVQIEYNTIVDTARNSGNCISAPDASGYIRNNICAGEQVISGGGTTISANQQGTTAAQDFNNPGADDYRLKSTSPARNPTTDVGCPAVDLIGVIRPQGGKCDRGSYEFDE